LSGVNTCEVCEEGSFNKSHKLFQWLIWEARSREFIVLIKVSETGELISTEFSAVLPLNISILIAVCNIVGCIIPAAVTASIYS
jgi:hypothetical protein